MFSSAPNQAIKYPHRTPLFYVLHLTRLSNHVGIDYYCYYLLNSYFLSLG